MTELPEFYEELAKKVAEKAFDEYIYNGKTLREWTDTLTLTQWIPVSERLPEDGEDVLVWYEYFRYGEYNCMCQTYGIGCQYGGRWTVQHVEKNTRCIAWQPLPEPYKVESEK